MSVNAQHKLLSSMIYYYLLYISILLSFVLRAQQIRQEIGWQQNCVTTVKKKKKGRWYPSNVEKTIAVAHISKIKYMDVCLCPGEKRWFACSVGLSLVYKKYLCYGGFFKAWTKA